MPRVRSLVTEAGHKIGDEYEVTESEARLLTALDLPGGPKAIIVDRAMRANDDAMELPKGFYKRRDLRAQK